MNETNATEGFDLAKFKAVVKEMVDAPIQPYRHIVHPSEVDAWRAYYSGDMETFWSEMERLHGGKND